MASRHPDGRCHRGNTLIVTGHLFGADGLPLDVPDVSVLTWAMTPERGIALPTDAAAGAIEVTDRATGSIKITIAAAATAALAPGRYVDELRVTIGEVVSELWRGTMTVDDSPFEPPQI